jgi:hypothetical protein
MSESIELTSHSSNAEDPGSTANEPPKPPTSTNASNLEAQLPTEFPKPGHKQHSLWLSRVQKHTSPLRQYIPNPKRAYTRTSRWVRKRWQILAKAIGASFASGFGGATLYYTKRSSDDAHIATYFQAKQYCESSAEAAGDPHCRDYLAKPKRFVRGVVKRMESMDLKALLENLDYARKAEEFARLLSA